MVEDGHPHTFYNLQFKAKNVNLVSQASTSPDSEKEMNISVNQTPSMRRQGSGEVGDSAIMSSKLGSPALEHTGWVELTDDIDLYAANPVRPGLRVYRGRQKHYGGRHSDVIVKLLGISPKTEQEIARLIDLNHPNIVRIIRSGEYLGKIPEIFIVMEDCLMDLQEYTNRNSDQNFPFEKSYSYSKQLTEGVNYIHKKNIVHRDLKPPNILISKCEHYIKISDFGISRVIPESSDGTLVTNINDGTEGFKAPETYKGLAEYSYRADIFSLGICIYYIVTNGKHPFDTNFIRRAYNIMDNQNRDLTQIPTFKRPDAERRQLLQHLIESTLQHEPASRPTASEILKHEFFSGDSETLHHLLELAECELELKRGREENSIQRVKDLITMSGSHSYLDAKKMARNLNEKGHHIRSMIFLTISYDLLINQRMSPASRVVLTKNYIVEIGNAIKPLMTEQESLRYIAETYGYHYMKNLFSDLREVKTDNKDLHILSEMRCLVGLTLIALNLNKNGECIEFGEHGVSIVEAHFGSKATDYKNYGFVLNNLGNAYRRLKQNSKAENCYLKALEADRKASDFASQDARQNEIKKVENNLEKTREQIHK